MNIMTRCAIIFLLASLVSCSDGTQVSQHITRIIDESYDDKIKDNDC